MSKKYRKLKCGPTSQQCGGTCISKGEECHVGKAALLKQNVKREINRLEQGKEPGAVTDKSLAKLLVTDPDIGQKLPKEFSTVIASSEKLDDRVKKSYFESATKKSWNIDESHGASPAIKLKKPDEAFNRKLHNRGLQKGIKVSGDAEQDKVNKKSKSFFKTDKGKKVLQIIAATATIGAAAAITAYGVKKGKEQVQANKASNKTTVKEVVQRSYQKDPSKVQAQEDIREAMRRAGDKVSNNTIGDSAFVTPTAAETYANMYDRAKYLETQVPDGLSTRQANDYKDAWGYAPGERSGRPATPDSKLGKAEAEARSYIKKEAPNATDAEISQGIDYLKNKQVYDRSRTSNNMQYNPESKEWERRTYSNDINKVKNPKTGVYEEATTLDYDKSDRSDIDKKQRQRGSADRLRREENSAQGSTYEQNRFQQSAVNGKGSGAIKFDPEKMDNLSLKDEGIFSGFTADSEIDKLDSFSQMNTKDAARQKKAWNSIDDDRRKQFADSEILRDLRGGETYGGDIIDGVDSARANARNYINRNLEEVYDKGTLRVLRQQKLGQIKTAIDSGLPVLPAFKSVAESIESEIDLGPSKSGKVTSGVSIADNMTDGLGTASGGKLTAKQRKQNELAAINPNIFKDVGDSPRYKRTGSGNISILTDSKGNKFKKKGERIFINGKEILGQDLQEKLRKAWMEFNFSETDEDLVIRNIIEVTNNVVVVDSNEGLLSLIYDSNNEVTIIPMH